MSDEATHHFSLDYSPAGVPVRADLKDAHRAILHHLRSPGSWFTGAERLAIAAESRSAEECGLCAARKAALSPEHAVGEHARASDLPDALVEIAHRIRMDSGRLSRAWFDRQLDSGLDDGRYVEAVGIIAMLAGLDAFCSAAGIPRFVLPEALPGAPSAYRPANLDRLQIELVAARVSALNECFY